MIDPVLRSEFWIFLLQQLTFGASLPLSVAAAAKAKMLYLEMAFGMMQRCKLLQGTSESQQIDSLEEELLTLS